MASSSGAEAVDLAATAGLILDDWQCWWLHNALAERRDGLWCSKEDVLITGRQSGKNGVLAALELFFLFLLGDPLVVHSAHELPTAINHFRFMLDLIDRTPDLSRKCKRPTMTNGQEAINLRSGAQLRFRARGKNSGRGLTADRLVFDEAFKIHPETMGALMPTMRARRNTKMVYASSAPHSDSVVLWGLINRGRDADPSDRLFYAEWGNPQGTALDDVDAWYQANPALGIRVEEQSLHDEYRSLVMGGNAELIAEFAREAVGIGEPLPDDTADRPVKLPADKWAATAWTGHEPAPEITLAVDCAPNGEWSTLAIGAGSISDPYVEVIEHRQGLGWVPEAVVGLVQRRKPLRVGLDPGGPAGALVAPLMAALADAGISADVVKLMTAAEMKQACAGFYGDVVEGRLRRPPDETQGPLVVAAGDATERVVGDAWLWDRRSATVPISPLVAVTIARALLPEKGDVKPVFWA